MVAVNSLISGTRRKHKGWPDWIAEVAEAFCASLRLWRNNENGETRGDKRIVREPMSSKIHY